MKKIIILSGIALMTCSILTAQNSENVQVRRQKQEMKRSKERDQAHIQEAAKIHGDKESAQYGNTASVHGGNVSSLARNTEPGHKGNIVRQEARIHGEGQRSGAQMQTHARNQSINRTMGARGNSMQNRNMRMYNRAGAAGHK